MRAKEAELVLAPDGVLLELAMTAACGSMNKVESWPLESGLVLRLEATYVAKYGRGAQFEVLRRI